MPNPLFNMLNQSAQRALPPGMSQFMNEFNRFKSEFKGDARSEIQRMLNTGQMTQEQYNQLSQAAKQFAGIFPR